MSNATVIGSDYFPNVTNVSDNSSSFYSSLYLPKKVGKSKRRKFTLSPIDIEVGISPTVIIDANVTVTSPTDSFISTTTEISNVTVTPSSDLYISEDVLPTKNVIKSPSLDDDDWVEFDSDYVDNVSESATSNPDIEVSLISDYVATAFQTVGENIISVWNVVYYVLGVAVSVTNGVFTLDPAPSVGSIVGSRAPIVDLLSEDNNGHESEMYTRPPPHLSTTTTSVLPSDSDTRLSDKNEVTESDMVTVRSDGDFSFVGDNSVPDEIAPEFTMEVPVSVSDSVYDDCSPECNSQTDKVTVTDGPVTTEVTSDFLTQLPTPVPTPELNVINSELVTGDLDQTPVIPWHPPHVPGVTHLKMVNVEVPDPNLAIVKTEIIYSPSVRPYSEIIIQVESSTPNPTTPSGPVTFSTDQLASSVVSKEVKNGDILVSKEVSVDPTVDIKLSDKDSSIERLVKTDLPSLKTNLKVETVSDENLSYLEKFVSFVHDWTGAEFWAISVAVLGLILGKNLLTFLCLKACF